MFKILMQNLKNLHPILNKNKAIVKWMIQKRTLRDLSDARRF